MGRSKLLLRALQCEYRVKILNDIITDGEILRVPNNSNHFLCHSIINCKAMRIINKYLAPAILALGLMIPIWFLVCNLQPLQPGLYAFMVCTFIGLYLAIKIFNNNLIVTAKRHVLHVTKRKYFAGASLLVITIVGLLTRLFFYFRFSYAPVSDPMTFYDSAKTLAAGGSLHGNSYVAFQPYLSAYNNILGVAMRLIHGPWLATILLNTFFDILSALAVYVLLKKLLRPGSQLPLVAFGVWMLNPLNIIFSVASLPVIIVNFFIISTILVSHLLIKQLTNLKTRNVILLSIALGLVLGFGNCFRPIFIVAILALVIVFIFMLLTANKSMKFLLLSVGCILLSVLIFTGIQKLNLVFVSHQTDLSAAKNPSGWSMYVGSSWDSSGEWRPHNNDELSSICKDSLPQNNFDKCHAELRSVVIARYKNYGILKSTSLFIRKLYHQAGQQNYFYNANFSIPGYTTSRTAKFIGVYSVIYMIAAFILSAKFLYGLAKQSVADKTANTTLLFVALLMIGWFLSFMIVESAPRYSTILYPAFIIFSVLALNSNFRSKHITK